MSADGPKPVKGAALACHPDGSQWIVGGSGLTGFSDNNEIKSQLARHSNGTWSIKRLGTSIPRTDLGPGSRYRAFAWIDTAGGLKIFGGLGYRFGSDPYFYAGAYYSDFWEFDDSGDNWSMIAGSSVADLPPVYP